MNSIFHHLFRPRLLAGTACAAILTAVPFAHANGVSEDKLIIHDTGRLIVNDELTVTDGDISIEDGGVMEVNTGSTTNATTLKILFGGLLTGCGTINANIINMGSIEAECGAGTMLIVDGEFTNGNPSGDPATTRIGDGTQLQVSGTLFNDQTGTLDIRGGSMTTGTFLNLGTFLSDGTLNNLQITDAKIDGSDFKVTAMTLVGGEYVLEVNLDLTPGNWIQIGGSETGTDSPITFTAPNGFVPGSKRFYRIRQLPAAP